MDRATPKLRLLAREQIKRVHETSLQILASTGVRIDSEAAIERLVRAGGRTVGGGRVLIDGGLVDWALDAVPKSVEVFDRLGEPAFVLGSEDGTTRFGVGVTNLFYQNPEDDAVVPFTREHLASSVRLAHALFGYDLVSTIGCPRDVSDEHRDLVATLEMAANTTKPLLVLVVDDKQVGPVLDLLAHVCPLLDSKPCAMLYVNPATPLAFGPGTVARMDAAISRGLPLVFSSYGMAGASTPITSAGTLALLNAELLAGLVLGQVTKPGTPMVLGSLPAAFDMSGMGSLYTPHSFLANLACAETMAHYGIPHCGTSGSGIGWGADLPAAANLWLNHATSCLGGAGIAPFVGGNFDSLVFSPTTVVYSDWVIAQCRSFASGIDLSDLAGLVEESAAVGPGGDFLTTPSTLGRFREFGADGSIWPNLSLERWRQAGQPEALDILRRRGSVLSSLP